MKIALLGDIALIGRYDRTKDNNVEHRVEYVKNIVSDCDFVIANQESVLTNKTSTFQCKGVYLRSAEENVKTLKYIGVTHVTLANNHIYDYGIKGRKDTERVLADAGIKTVGLCGNPSILEKNGERAMLDGFCCLSANALRYGKKSGKVQLLTYDAIDTFLCKAKNENCIPIVSAHFGVEGLHYPSNEHIKLFRELAQNYNYILHGNHPHAMQGIEKVKDSLLVYAQGNLCFDECNVTSINEIYKQTIETRKGYVVILDFANGKVTDYKVIPVTDIDDGILRENITGYEEVKKYSDALCESGEHIESLRRAEIKESSSQRAKRDVSFYLHRLNAKYLGAFINGHIHSMRYHKVFDDFLKR